MPNNSGPNGELWPNRNRAGLHR